MILKWNDVVEIRKQINLDMDRRTLTWKTFMRLSLKNSLNLLVMIVALMDNLNEGAGE